MIINKNMPNFMVQNGIALNWQDISTKKSFETFNSSIVVYSEGYIDPPLLRIKDKEFYLGMSRDFLDGNLLMKHCEYYGILGNIIEVFVIENYNDGDDQLLTKSKKIFKIHDDFSIQYYGNTNKKTMRIISKITSNNFSFTYLDGLYSIESVERFFEHNVYTMVAS